MVLSNETMQGSFETMQDHAPEAKTMHETMQPSDPFPELTAIARSPVVLPSGRVLKESGYDPESSYYLSLNGLSNVEVSMDVDRAVAILTDETFGEFPLVDDASRAHVLALVLQPFVMPLIDGPTPLYLIEAPTPGTGKGLMAEVIGKISHGRSVGVMAQPKDEEEMRKRILALLLGGHTMVCLDNVYRLTSGNLSMVLTSKYFEDRILGSSRMVRVRNRATWLATGNNVELSDEVVRRTLLIRLDAKVERPEDRTGFKHADLATWATTNRTRLVAACLSIITAWAERGMPAGSATMGSFEEWASVMGGILEVAGVPGFLANRDSLHSASDRQSQEWVAFCQAWWEKFSGLAVTAKQLFGLAKETDLLLDLWGGRSALGGQQRVGHALGAMRGRVFGQFKIEIAGRDGASRNRAYRLENIYDGDGMGA